MSLLDIGVPVSAAIRSSLRTVSRAIDGERSGCSAELAEVTTDNVGLSSGRAITRASRRADRDSYAAEGAALPRPCNDSGKPRMAIADPSPDMLPFPNDVLIS